MKKIIIAIAFVSVIIISLLIVRAGIIEDKKNKDMKPGNSNIEITHSLDEIKSVTDYETVSNCINVFLDYIYKNNQQAIDAIIIKDYNKNDSAQLPKINYENEYSVKKIFCYDGNINVKTYLVFGDILNKEELNKEEFNFIVNIDIPKKTFEIAPLDAVYKDYVDFSDINNIKISDSISEKIDRIQLNNYNEANIVQGIEEKQICTFYFKEYIKEMLYYTKDAYNKLDKKYKENRFDNFNDFEQYIETNKNYLKTSFVLKYKVVEYEKYTEFLCVDKNNNYYIFKQTKPMEYTVVLDQYTIEDKIQNDIYITKDKKERAQMLLNLINQMINTQDYRALYDVLNDDFKNKYFQNEEELAKYLKKNFFKYNEFKYSDVLETNDGVRIKTEISDCENTENKTIKRFLVKIVKDNYYISFDI